MKIFALSLLIMMLIAPMASAHEFIQKPAESGFIDEGGTQIFTTNVGTISCTEQKGTGSSSSEKSAELAIAVAYVGCKGPGKKATVSEGQYKYNANGTVTLGFAIEIALEAEDGSVCTITLEPKDNNEREGITYTNNSPGITFSLGLKAIAYEVKGKTSGGFCCPHIEEKANNGELKGEAKAVAYSGEDCIWSWLFGDWEKKTCEGNFSSHPWGWKKTNPFSGLSYS
jgi:hypothetical protein